MYQTVYAACDTYLERSIKSSEREIRGQAETFVIRSPDIRIPPDFKNFLNNGTNKERLLELTEDVWKGEAAALGNQVVYFARQCTCVRLTSQRVETIDELPTNHEEADTKICYLLHHAVESNNNEETVCVVRSSSGDIDIPVILLANEMPNLLVYVDNGAGKNRKVMDLSSCSLSKDQTKALLGMHVFTGNDYVSSFLWKGKQVCWKLIKDSAEFLQIFGELGPQDSVSESTAAGLEKFVYSLYCEKRLSSVNRVQKIIFWRSYSRDNKVIDLSLLPPCQTSLERHIRRANYVARIWRQASHPMMNIQDPQFHGWNEDLSTDWISLPYP